MPSDAVVWLRRWWRALVSEVIATFLLVLVGVGSLARVGGPARPLTDPALAFGFVVTTLVYAFGGCSGAYMNPAISLAGLIFGTLKPGLAFAYTAAQVIGAVGGAATLALLVPEEEGLGVTSPAPALAGPGAGAALEALLTAALALAVCAAWASPPDPSAPVKIGLTIAGLIYGGGPMTGASMNPARSLGPAIVHMRWEHHWIYWVGPLGGAAVAAALFRWVVRPGMPPPPPAPRPEELPLRDKPDA